MPGVFGYAGHSKKLCEELKREFSDAWGYCDSTRLTNGLIGGHAFRPNSAVYSPSNTIHFAIDGEAPLYRMAKSFVRQGSPALFCIRSRELELTADCKGNIAVVDTSSNAWHLGSEWTGTFPLYYIHVDGGFAFSSRLRPLARIMGAPYDPYGIVEFLLEGYTFAGRTHYQGIHRVLPGQVITYECDADSLKVRETSRLWAGEESLDSDAAGSSVEAAWHALNKAVRKVWQPEGKHALMMSGGWDSRLLLAVLLKCLDASHLIAYSHGNVRSRELRLVDAICQSIGIECYQEPLGNAICDLDRLKQAFNHVESTLFPYWHHAGLLLAKTGARCVSAGVYGEVLGGHYGPAMLLRGRKKIAAVARPLLGLSSNSKKENKASQHAFHLVSYRDLSRPGFLSQAFWDNLAAPEEAINSDISACLHRLEARGINKVEQLIEGFIAEHRGSQYINAQILSCRTVLDITLPFIDRDLLMLASHIPLASKIHNLMDRKIFQLYAPDLLLFPTAASLIPAAAPILLQEITRTCRRFIEEGMKKVAMNRSYRAGPFRNGWPNFDFLQSGEALRPILDDLKCGIWDKEALDRSLSDLARHRGRYNIFQFSHRFFRIYMADLMLR